MNRLPALILAAVILAACSAPDAPTEQRQVAAPAPAPAVDGCAHVGELFDLYAAKRQAGEWTEDDALADLRDRGEFGLAYVVDGAFGTRYGEAGSALARAEVMRACRNGGTAY